MFDPIDGCARGVEDSSSSMYSFKRLDLRRRVRSSDLACADSGVGIDVGVILGGLYVPVAPDRRDDFGWVLAVSRAFWARARALGRWSVSSSSSSLAELWSDPSDSEAVLDASEESCSFMLRDEGFLDDFVFCAVSRSVSSAARRTLSI